MNRRDFLRLGALGAGGLSVGRLLAKDGAYSPLSGATIGPAVRVLGLHGDTWPNTWADDGAIYAAADDCFGLKTHPINSNLAIFRITGSPPDLRLETINPMTEYGRQTSLLGDGASWKATGLLCLDGILYLSVSRHHYMEAQSAWIQQSWDASIVKSDDHGRTWSPAPRLGRAMFPGRIFSNPYFVQYGRDGAAGPDGSDRYVYAVSNDGMWNNGNWMTVGRVRRDRIGRLDPADWEFVHRLDKDHRPAWGVRHDNALATFYSPGRASMTSVQHFAALGRYLMPQWYYPRLDAAKDADRWNLTRLELYQAPAPWGPWTLFHAQDFAPQGYYNPSFPLKFVSPDGRRCWMWASGDFFPSPGGNPFYTINQFPVSLEVG